MSISRGRIIGFMAACLLIGSAASASADDVTIGGEYPATINCTGQVTLVQDNSGGGSAMVFDGVITSWRFLVGNVAPRALSLRIGRYVSDHEEIIGASPAGTPVAGTTFTQQVRIPVKEKDVLGLYVDAGSGSGAPCRSPGGRYTFLSLYQGDYQSGPLPSGTSYQQYVGVAAVLERDADKDGYGDTTQDKCPTDATTHDTCPAPASTVFTPTKTLAVTGDATVGDQVRTTGIARSNFTPTPDKVRVRWYAAGKKIKGAKKHTYTVRDADVGKTLKAIITVTGAAPTKTYTVKTGKVTPTTCSRNRLPSAC